MTKKKKSETKTPDWVDQYLVPLKPCIESGAVDRARAFPDPQSAWDAWDDGSEMLWCLWQTDERDVIRLIICGCEIVESVLSVFEKNHRGDPRPREAVESAWIYIEKPTSKNRRAARDAALAVSDVDSFVGIAADFLARAAGDANCNYITAAAVYTAAVAAAHARVGEHSNQADIVRKHFPVSPFLKTER